MPSSSDTPGWLPDPEHPGALRWWNGLGWSDARKAVDATGATGVRPVAEGALRRVAAPTRSSTVAPGPLPAGGVTSTTTSPVPRPVAALRAVNPAAGAALVLGVLGFLFGALWLIPLAGVVVSLAALARGRRLARQGVRPTGSGRSLAGLLLSVLGLARWIPAVLTLLSSIRLE